MSAIEKLLKAIPYIRRPYFQRDAALAKLDTVTAELAALRLGGKANGPTGINVGQLFRRPTWFLLPDEDARQDQAIGDFRSFVANAVGKRAAALEIGPSLNPILPKSAGYRVTIVDHQDQSGLIEKYTPYGIDVSKIEAVDAVIEGNSIAGVAGDSKFDAIVAAHVIEHAPDLVEFLNDCSTILSGQGSIYLIVPDKRYGFDFLQPLTDVAKVLGDHRVKRTRHSFESLYRQSAHVYNGEAIAWDQGGISRLQFPYGDPNRLRWEAEQGEVSASYVDAHENYFTPVSFALIVDELRYLREIDLAIRILTRPRGCEFLAVLRRADQSDDMAADAFLQRKMDGCRLLLLEEQERINSASGILAN